MYLKVVVLGLLVLCGFKIFFFIVSILLYFQSWIIIFYKKKKEENIMLEETPKTPLWVLGSIDLYAG